MFVFTDPSYLDSPYFASMFVGVSLVMRLMVKVIGGVHLLYFFGGKTGFFSAKTFHKI